MKRQLLTILCLTPTLMFAQTTIQSDNFDSYTSGIQLTGQTAGLWETWSGGSGTAEDPMVSAAFASSGANSMNVSNGGPGVYEDDVIMATPATYTTGVYEVKMKIYIPAGNGGYFNIGSAWSTGGAAYEYGIDVFFNTNSTGAVNAPSTGIFQYNQDAWNDVSVMIDLGTTMADLKINSVSAGSFAWGTALGFDAMDIFGYALTDATLATEGTANFYVDDVEVLNWTGVGLDENDLNAQLSIVPNPSNGNMVISTGEFSLNNAAVSIVDITGKVVYNENLSFGKNGSNAINLDVVDGIYFVNITDGNQVVSKKISIKK